MGEFVVKWRHLRYPSGIDDFHKDCLQHRVSVNDLLRCAEAWGMSTTRELAESEKCPSQHGGQTRCRIYQVVDAPEGGERGALKEVASAEAVCSWRDQFSRKVGRLYSLALALCEMSNLTPDDLDLWDALGTQTHDYCKPYQFGQLCDCVLSKDKPAVKRICAEIVGEWRKPRRARMLHTMEGDCNAKP